MHRNFCALSAVRENSWQSGPWWAARAMRELSLALSWMSRASPLSNGSSAWVSLLTFLKKNCRMEEQSIWIPASFLPVPTESDATWHPPTTQENQAGVVPARNPRVFIWEKILQFQRLPSPNKILKECNDVTQHLKKKILKVLLYLLWFGVCVCMCVHMYVHAHAWVCLYAF